MSGMWLQAFFDSFNNGVSINKAVFEANAGISKFNNSTSQIFYAPQGRLAMHLYGNPNVHVSLKYPDTEKK